MTISPGKFFVVHYRFPKYQKTFSKQNMREGPTISIPAAKCSVMLPPSDVDRDVTFTCKVSTIGFFWFLFWFRFSARPWKVINGYVDADPDIYFET